MKALIISKEDVFEIPIDLLDSKIHYFELDKSINPTEIILYENGIEYRKISISSETFDSILQNSGTFKRLL